MDLLDSKKEIKTKVIKTAKLDKNTMLTIEKILKGDNKNKYVVKSYSKILFIGYKPNDLAAYNIDTNFDGGRIVKIEYPIFTFVKQASEYLTYIQNNRFGK